VTMTTDDLVQRMVERGTEAFSIAFGEDYAAYHFKAPVRAALLAALEEMREPSEELQAAAYGHNPLNPKGAWRAMLSHLIERLKA
jgi:hypothetical protein